MMTPINTPPDNNFNSGPSSKTIPPLWQRLAMGILGLAVALYLIFQVALPGFRARQAAIDGPTPPASAPAH